MCNMKNSYSQFLYKLFKESIKIIIAIAILVTSALIYNWYIQRSAKLFCDNIKSSDTVESVIAFANKKGHQTSQHQDGARNRIVISTQDSPFFRFACRVEFNNGILQSTQVVSDD